MKDKNVYIITGPNGSGKTTFAHTFLPEYAKCTNFINADLIAQGLAPFGPRSAALKAGKLVLEQIREFSRRGADFAFETTLSGRSYARVFKDLKTRGYSLTLFFLWIPRPELAISRIKERVADGGHDVPEMDVKRRFERGIRNFFMLYRPLLDSWTLFDNSSAKPVVIAEEKAGAVTVICEDLFGIIKKI